MCSYKYLAATDMAIHTIVFFTIVNMMDTTTEVILGYEFCDVSFSM